MIVWANLLNLCIFLENSTRPGILAIESGLSGPADFMYCFIAISEII